MFVFPYLLNPRSASPRNANIYTNAFPTTYCCPRLLTVVSACLSFPLEEPLINARVSFYYGATTANGPGPPHFWGFTITFRHTTLGRTPLDEWPARHRGLYLTTHNTHKRQTSMPRRDSNPQSQQASGRKPTPQTARPPESALHEFCCAEITNKCAVLW